MNVHDTNLIESTRPARLLLVGANQRWTRMVTAASEHFGVAMDTACNPGSALTRIVAAPEPYSLVLLQPKRTDRALHHLADLTAGDTDSGTGLFLLGAHGPELPGSIVVEQPNRASFEQALNQYRCKPNHQDVDLSSAELRASLHGTPLKLRYQPLIRLADRKPIGLEVLARLGHADHGILSAERFIPRIAACGLLQLLTRTVIAQAMREAGEHELTQAGLRIALNVPLDVLMLAETCEILETERQQYAIPADQIIIELTETQPVEDLHGLRDVLRRLRGLGYRVSIDDASPAMRNLDAMLELGFTHLKFDKAVVQQSLHGGDHRDFIQRVTRNARAAGMHTVAEGIEDSTTLDRMHALGVDSGQGFLIGRPLPPAAVRLWLDAWRVGEEI